MILLFTPGIRLIYDLLFPGKGLVDDVPFCHYFYLFVWQ